MSMIYFAFFSINEGAGCDNEVHPQLVAEYLLSKIVGSSVSVGHLQRPDAKIVDV
jgi:hypothetical protein